MHIGWEAPGHGWVKINADGSVKDQKSAACGGVCRDENGRWVIGFGKYLGVSSVLMAELWGLYTGMKMAWERGWQKVVFSLDSKTEITLVQPCTATGRRIELLIVWQILRVAFLDRRRKKEFSRHL